MSQTNILDSVPPVLLALGITAILALVVECCFRIGYRSKGQRGLKNYPVEASVMTALLGLFAFLLAFSFGSAASRYTKTRDLVLEDANIVETAYLRADFLPDPLKVKAKALLVEYLSLRVEVVAKGDLKAFPQALTQSRMIQQELWQLTSEPAVRAGNPALQSLFASSLNELFDNSSRREWTALHSRFPRVLWLTLGFLGLLCAGMVGLSAGLHGRPARLATTTLLISFSIVAALIVDLDRPVRSLVKSQDPNASVLEKLRAEQE